MTQGPEHADHGDLGPPAEPVEPAEPADAADAPAGPAPGSFGDGAAEMANETEVEEEPAGQFPDAADDELTVTQMALAERTADLQRLQAEFLNYKRRVDRDRDLIRENATYTALTPIIDVLDTIDRAREHGDLDPGFQAVADQLRAGRGGAGAGQLRRRRRRVRPDHPRGPLPHRGGPRGRGHHVQGDRAGPATGSASGWCAPRRCWWSTRRVVRPSRDVFGG